MINWLPRSRCPRIMGQHLRPDRYIATDEAQLKGKQASEKKEVHNVKVKNKNNAVLQTQSVTQTHEKQSLCACFC